MFFLSPDPVEVVRVDGKGKERAGVLKWGTVSVAQEVSGRQYLVGARGIREGDSEGVNGELRGLVSIRVRDGVRGGPEGNDLTRLRSFSLGNQWPGNGTRGRESGGQDEKEHLAEHARAERFLGTVS